MVSWLVRHKCGKHGGCGTCCKYGKDGKCGWYGKYGK